MLFRKRKGSVVVVVVEEGTEKLTTATFFSVLAGGGRVCGGYWVFVVCFWSRSNSTCRWDKGVIATTVIFAVWKKCVKV